MPCANTHRVVNFAAAFSYLASRAKDKQNGIAHPLVGSSVLALLATLPDVIEPAIHPHHRQFFHSVTFAGVVGYGVYRAYSWQTQTPQEDFIRSAALVLGSAYLLHLLADSLTSRSLPLIGK